MWYKNHIYTAPSTCFQRPWPQVGPAWCFSEHCPYLYVCLSLIWVLSWMEHRGEVNINLCVLLLFPLSPSFSRYLSLSLFAVRHLCSESLHWDLRQSLSLPLSHSVNTSWQCTSARPWVWPSRSPCLIGRCPTFSLGDWETEHSLCRLGGIWLAGWFSLSYLIIFMQVGSGSLI